MEREEKFLVDLDRLDLSTYQVSQILQCYLVVDPCEVRFRKKDDQYTTTIKRRTVDIISRHEVEFSIPAKAFYEVWEATPWRLQKRRYSGGDMRISVYRNHLETFDRIGRWGSCVECPSVGTITYPEQCIHTARYDHQLEGANSWCLDVFESGQLKGFAFAEVEIPECYSFETVAEYLHAFRSPWPAWLARDAADNLISLTTYDVNYVAAGVKPMSRRLRQILDAYEASKPARSRRRYEALPLNRQGIRDLGYGKRKAVSS